MNFLKRAYFFTVKHKVKTLLLIISFCVIGTMLFCSIGIDTAANAVQNNALQNINARVKVSFDTNKAQRITNSDGTGGVIVPPLEENILNKISSINHVRAYNYIYYYQGKAENFEIIYDYDKYANASKLIKDHDKQVTATGITDTSLLDEFATNTYKLVSGRHITKADGGKNVVLIEKKLADKNNLQVNDTIKVGNIYEGDACLDLKIVGIFTAPPSSEFDEGLPGFDPSDTIYLPIDTGLPLTTFSDYHPPVSATYAYYFIDDPSNIDSFAQAAKKVSGMEDYLLTTDSNLYSRITGPVKSTHAIASIMIVIILFTGCLILALIIALSLNGRRREFGILIAMGEKKFRLFLQVFTETLFPVAIAFCIAIFASGFVSQKICDTVIDNSVSIVESQDSADANDVNKIIEDSKKTTWLGEFDNTMAKPIDKISVGISAAEIAEFSLFGLIIVIVSVLIPLARIIMLRPMAILSRKG